MLLGPPSVQCFDSLPIGPRMRHSRLLIGTVLPALLFLTPAWADLAPNILLIVSEDNGPELGSYGGPYARTPNLDRLAEQGVRFENAFVPYSVCSPSRAAFLTGLYPVQNGQIGLATHKFAMYRKDTPNFATLLKSSGYYTGLIGKLHVNPESAFVSCALAQMTGLGQSLSCSFLERFKLEVN